MAEKKDRFNARAKAVKATEELNQALNTMDTASAIGAFERMEEKVQQMKAGSSEIGEFIEYQFGDPFDPLEPGSDMDAELQLLKNMLEPDPQLLLSGASGTLPFNNDAIATLGKQPAVIDAELEALKAELEKPPTGESEKKREFPSITDSIERIEHKLQKIEDLSREAFRELAELKTQLKGSPKSLQ